MMYRLAEDSPSADPAHLYVAPSASVIGKVRLGRDSSVWFNAVLRGDSEWISVGARCNIQDGAVLHADPGLPLTLEDGVTVGHMAMLHGCTIGADTLIGIGARVLNGARIGRGSIVAAGALVTEGKSFPDGSVLMGIPARVTRQATEDDRQSILHASRHYVENARRYRESLAADSRSRSFAPR